MRESHADRAIVVGGSGGIGAALAAGLEDRGVAVTRLSRRADDGELAIDVTHEDSIAAAAEALRGQGPFATIIVATGLLHGDEVSPEKSLRDVDADSLARLFAVNAIGPLLVAKHFVPLLPKEGRCVFAALSARVGSISDNRLGGWYGYRASKAALNMVIRTLAIEVGRARPEAICAGLHPGTVDTRLSAPFQRGVAPGRLFTPRESAGHLLDVIGGLRLADSGRCFGWDGREILP